MRPRTEMIDDPVFFNASLPRSKPSKASDIAKEVLRRHDISRTQDSVVSQAKPPTIDTKFLADEHSFLSQAEMPSTKPKGSPEKSLQSALDK